MIGLQCQLCHPWHKHFTSMEGAIAGYLFHLITDHWEMLEKAHNEPKMLAEAKRLIESGLL